ncbi:metal ABC transporter substrate-binding protein, partial [Levilactobacillus brevis]|nr:metal ABC transporter substrate-binding protein [Levilactobacillus brevis]
VLPKLARQIKRQAKGQQVAVRETVFDLSLTAMGDRVSDGHIAQAIQEGSDPTPADITHLQAQIKHHRIAFFVENTQNSSKNVTAMVQLARRYHVPVVKVTETMPAHQSYRTWMLSQYQQVKRIQEDSHS